jgi:hypothetical protein
MNIFYFSMGRILNRAFRLLCRRGQKGLWFMLLFALSMCIVMDRQLREDPDTFIAMNAPSNWKYSKHVRDLSDPNECPNNLRVERLKKICKQNEGWHENIFEGKSVSKLHHLWVSDYHKLVYCDIPKAGSTTFKYLISMKTASDMADEAARKGIHNYTFLREHSVVQMTELSVQAAQQRLNNYFKFIVVRHPFSRLLSAYRDKIYPLGWYVNEYAQVIDGYYGRGTVSTRLSTAQFLELVTRRNSDFDDTHWRAYHKLCFPCDINYDQIIKLETIDKDTKLVMKHIFGSDKYAEYVPKLNHRRVLKSRPLEVNAKFWEQSHQLTWELLDLYRRDFEVFGYDWNPADGIDCGDKHGCGPDMSCI